MALDDDTWLNVDGLRLRLTQTERGPLLDTSDSREDPLAALGYVVNEAVSGAWPDLEKAIEERRGANFPQLMGVSPVDPEDVTYFDRLRWRSIGGGKLDELDAFSVGTTFTYANMVVPGKTLLRIVRKLSALRGGRPPSDETEVEEPDTLGESPFPVLSREEAVDFDERAVELDMMERKTLKTPEEEGAVIGERRVLLNEMEAAGLFDETHEEEKRKWLVEARLTALLGYYDAGLALLRYLRDPARRRYIPDAPEDEALCDAWVSIDWFRLGVPTPPAMKPVNWLGFCERTLREDDPEGSPGKGDVFTSVGGERYHIEWRRDAMTPAVLRASVMERS